MMREFKAPSEVYETIDQTPGIPPAVQRLMETWAKQWSTELGYWFLDGLERERVTISKLIEGNRQSIDEGRRATANLIRRLLSGEIPGAEALRELSQIDRLHGESLRVQSRAAEAEQRWLESAEADVEVRLAQQRERFPAAGWTRVMTDEYLAGKEPSPFMRRGDR